jgi:hypothetical protein
MLGDEPTGLGLTPCKSQAGYAIRQALPLLLCAQPRTKSGMSSRAKRVARPATILRRWIKPSRQCGPITAIAEAVR